MAFELFCATMFALLIGLAICFAGYRLFLVLLPVWGFFFGFGLGAQTMQQLFGQGFLATTSSWVLGFIVGVLFAVLSYLFYIFGVAIVAGSIGYIVGVSFMFWIGVDPGFLSWLVGIILGVALVVVTIIFNLQKYVVIIGTSIIGAGLMAGTLAQGFLGVTMAKFLENPIKVMLNDNPWIALLFLVVAIAGIVVQLRAKPVPEIDSLASSS